MSLFDPFTFTLSLFPGIVFVGIALVLEAFCRARGRSFVNSASYIEWVIAGGIMWFLGIVLFPFPVSGCKASPGQMCLSNVKQLDLGVLMYAEDFDDHFAPASQWGTSLQPYVKNDRLFKCPKAESPYGYASNLKLDRISQKRIRDDASTVAIFEADAHNLNSFGASGLLVPVPRHNEKNIFGFADGHAKYVPKAATLKWKP